MAKSYPKFLVLLLCFFIAVPSPAATKKKSAKAKTSQSSAAKKKRKTAEKTPEPPPPPLQPGELPLAARAAISLNAKNGDVLYEKAADTLEYPASATKILTALLVIEAGDLDRSVVVEEVDTKVEPSALYIKPGEIYSRRNLLYALLLKSANDVAMALARDNAGSVQAFAKKMTDHAAELGAQGSHFENPHGLHHPHHYVTARDLALITRAALQNPLFRQIVRTSEFRFAHNDGVIFVRNHNKLLARVPECIGVKTGYTRPAQQVLVSAAARSGAEVISVVLHTNKPGIWEDSKTLLAHGLEKLGAGPEEPSQLCLFPPFPDPK